MTPRTGKLFRGVKTFFPSTQGIFFSPLSLSPMFFSLNPHSLSSQQPREVEDNINKESIKKQYKVHPPHLSGWQFKGALPTCNPVVCFKNSVCPRKKRRANPGSRSFPKGSFFLSLQPGAFAWNSVLWVVSFFKLSHWFFTFVGSWKKNEAEGWGRDSILPG